MSVQDPALSLVPADRIALGELAALFARAYSDYLVPLHLDEPALRSMIRNWDLSLADSRVVLQGGVPVAFACLAVRGNQGWVGGMGVPPEHRGHRLGEVAMRAILDAARERGLAQVGLEVLYGNDHARELYLRLGFETIRSLEIWSVDPLLTPAAGTRVVEPCSVVEALATAGPGRAPFAPWQRTTASIANMQAHGATLEAFTATFDAPCQPQKANASVIIDACEREGDHLVFSDGVDRVILRVDSAMSGVGMTSPHPRVMLRSG